MTRSLYSFTIFFTALSIFVGIINCIALFRVGGQIYSLESFRIWFLAANAITIIAGVLYLKYFQYRKYDIAFNTSVLALVAGVVHALTLIGMLYGMQQLGSIIPFTAILTLLTGIISATALIFSRAGEKRWLKLTGVMGTIIGSILLGGVLWGMFSPSYEKNMQLMELQKWCTLAMTLVPLLLVKHFLDEQKLVAREQRQSPPAPARSADTVLVALCLSAFVASLVLAQQITSQSYWLKDWNSKAAERAQVWNQRFESRVFVNETGDTLRYQLAKPLNYDSTIKYPVVVCLPYGNGVEGCPPAQLLSEYENRHKYPAFLYVPFNPEGSGWGGIPNYPTIDTLAIEAMLSLEDEFSIDTQRRYITGVSRGGYGSWHFISTRPELFAAAVPVCGGGDVGLARNISGVAVWAFHGEKDFNVPVKHSRDLIQVVSTSGAKPRYTEYEGAGHNIWDQVKATPDLLEWMFAQRRVDTTSLFPAR